MLNLQIKLFYYNIIVFSDNKDCNVILNFLAICSIIFLALYCYNYSHFSYTY